MSTEDQKKGFSRRSFFKGSAIAALGVATGGILAGCQPASKTSEKGASEAVSGKPKPSWATPPAPIDDSQIKATKTADVIVVGAGIAGLTAALSALEAGAKVIAIEKNTTSRIGGSMIATINSKYQKSLGINLDKEEVFRGTIRETESMCDQRVVKVWLDHSGEVMDWLLPKLDAAGVKYENMLWPTPKGYDRTNDLFGLFPTAINVGIASGESSALMLQALTAEIKKAGGVIDYSTPAVQLIRMDKGRVTGVIAKNANGEYVKYTAKAVILCSGDFSNDPEMVDYYCAPDQAQLCKTRNIYTSAMKEQPKVKLNTGDGQKMAMWIGGYMEEGPVAVMGWATSTGMGWNDNTFLRVNALGERYENEELTPFYQNRTLTRQPGGISWEVWDAKYEEDIKKMAMADVFGIMPFTEEAKTTMEKSALKADTIEELAGKMKVPAEALKATIARRNELNKKGEDVDFGLPPNRLTSIEKAPFYASKVEPTAAVTVGGIRANTKLQALDTEGRPIPGLYLAGNTVGQRFGLQYNPTQPGHSNGYAVTHGYFAGKNATAEKA